MDRRTAIALAIAGLAVALPLVTRVALPDAPAPIGLSRPIGEFGTVLARNLDQLPLTQARYVEALSGEDELIVLVFELRPYPYVVGRLAVLVSRCTPLEALDPAGMGGGFVLGDVATDPELAYLRSDAQPACPSG